MSKTQYYKPLVRHAAATLLLVFVAYTTPARAASKDETAAPAEPTVCRATYRAVPGNAVADEQEAQNVCQLLAERLGHAPTLAVVKRIALLVSRVRTIGGAVDAPRLALDAVNIVDARHQLGSEPATLHTLDVIEQGCQLTKGQATPSALYQAMRRMGLWKAAQLSDDGVLGLAARISINQNLHDQ